MGRSAEICLGSWGKVSRSELWWTKFHFVRVLFLDSLGSVSSNNCCGTDSLFLETENLIGNLLVASHYALYVNATAFLSALLLPSFAIKIALCCNSCKKFPLLLHRDVSRLGKARSISNHKLHFIPNIYYNVL